jgi:hypothetical protein
MKTRAAKTNLRDFTFSFRGAGHYDVTYQSPVTGRMWKALITDMTIIDATKNSDEPKQVDIDHLKRVVKRGRRII